MAKKVKEFIPETFNPSPLMVTICPTAYSKIRHGMDLAGNIEVSGFGKVLKMANRFHICDAFLLKQENTDGSTDIDAAAITKAHFLKREEPGDFNFWWHSHHNMSAYFSQVDFDNIKLFGQHGWLLSTVFNHRGEQQTSLYTSHPMEIYMPNLPFQIGRAALPTDMQAEITAQYKELCSEKKWDYSGYTGGGYTGRDYRRQGTMLDDDDRHILMRDYEGLPSWSEVPTGGSDKDQWDKWFDRLEQEAQERELANEMAIQYAKESGEEEIIEPPSTTRLLMSANAPKAELRKLSKKERKRFRSAHKRLQFRPNKLGGKRLVWDKTANALIQV